MKKWQKYRLFMSLLIIGVGGLIYIIATSLTLHNDRVAEDGYWDNTFVMNEDAQKIIDEYGTEATKVTTGTYLENIKELNIKSSSFRVEMLVWFKWEGNDELDMSNNFRFYKGTMNKMSVVEDYHKDGMNYQQIRCDVSFTKNYWARRFPLESHQLKMYLESNLPINDVVFVADKENSGLNGSLSIAGYDVKRSEMGAIAMKYENSRNDPRLADAKDITTSEIVTAVELVRDGWGLYLKCFIALGGTTLWVLITLFLSTYHRIDPLSMIPAALFGTVSNIMVGANLLPDALQTGLLEYVNIWGIFTILSVAVSIININRIRSKYEDKAFATFYGKTMFYTILVIILIGHIAIPLSAVGLK